MSDASAEIAVDGDDTAGVRRALEALYPREEDDRTIPAPRGSDAYTLLARYLHHDAEIRRHTREKERCANQICAVIRTHGGVESEVAIASWRTVAGRANWKAVVESLKLPERRLAALAAKFTGAGRRELRVRARARV